MTPDDLRDLIARALRDRMFPEYADHPVGPAWGRQADAVLVVLRDVGLLDGED